MQRGARRRQAGFSLFEVLVVLVIVGLVSALAMGMVSQLRLVVSRFFPAAEHYSRLQVRVGMLTSMIGSLVPARSPEWAFKGDGRSATGLATYFPASAWPGEQPSRISIAGNETRAIVTAERFDHTGARLEAFEILSLPCTRARFRYLDIDMTWKDSWTQSDSFPLLPLAILFSCDSSEQPLHVIAAIEREGITIANDHHPFETKR